LHRQTRKIIKTRGHFPTEDAARKLIYLAIQKAEARWQRVFHWQTALAEFKSSSAIVSPTLQSNRHYLTRQE
jgi:transposase-like protein